MAKIHTHYDNLKVARNAPPEVIRAAYKSLSKKYHPDHNPGNPDAVRIIQLINSAYDVLSDPPRREEHDRWIAQEEALQKAPSRTHTQAHAAGWQPHTSSRRAGTRKREASSSPLHRMFSIFEQWLRNFYRRT